MKKIFSFAAMVCLAIGSLLAQNNFKGTISYSVTSTGETAFTVPDQIATAEVKVYDSKVLTSNQLFFGGNPFASNVLVDGHKQYVCMDLSQLFMYLSSNDVELDYKGSSKILVTQELTQSDIDSLTIPVTEGFYIEYVAGETKSIALSERMVPMPRRRSGTLTRWVLMSTSSSTVSRVWLSNIPWISAKAVKSPSLPPKSRAARSKRSICSSPAVTSQSPRRNSPHSSSRYRKN